MMNPALSEKLKITSFISIVLVVFLHAYNLEPASPFVAPAVKNFAWAIQDLLSNGFTRIAVPYFFIVSGYLYFYKLSGRREEFWAQIKKRVHTLLLPFLFWSLAGIAFYFLLQTPLHLQAYFSKELVVNFTTTQWLDKIFVHPIPYQFWFIRDLMLLVLASPVIHFACSRLQLPFLCVCTTLWFLPLGELHNSAEALLFFAIGSTLAVHYKTRIESVSSWPALPLFMAWLLMVFFKTAAAYLAYNELLVQALLNGSIVLGVLFFWTAVEPVLHSQNRIIKAVFSLSGSTFFIYASHEPALTIVKKISFKVLGYSQLSLLLIYFLAPIGVIFVAAGLSVFCKNKFGNFYRHITGGR